MNSFMVTITVLLLSIFSSKATPFAKPETLATSASLQSDFVYHSNQLAMPWDTITLADNADSCIVYDRLTLFNLTSLRGPYHIEIDLDKDVNGGKEKLEVHFCNPVQQNDSNKNRSLVYLRNTDTDDP
jgi:hypothetical protein